MIDYKDIDNIENPNMSNCPRNLTSLLSNIVYTLVFFLFILGHMEEKNIYMIL
jgi:hypothetical protein